MDVDFLVCTDESKEGLGGFLMQDGPLIAYVQVYVLVSITVSRYFRFYLQQIVLMNPTFYD
jgi:hypothetical protein